MSIKRLLSLGVAGVGMSAMMALSAASPAQAVCTTPFGSGGTALQGVLDGITTGPVAGTSSVNVVTDCLGDAADTHWSIQAAGASVQTIIVELAAFAPNNTFGIYDAANPLTTVEIFAGADSSGSQAFVSILATGEVRINTVDTGVFFAANAFGWYLDSTANVGGGFWTSDTALNSDGTDHMSAYQGSGIDTIQILPFSAGTFATDEFILAFEDLDCAIGCDLDYTDFVVIVESVEPIPEPGTLSLFGLGLLGLGFLLRRRQRPA